MTPNDQNKCSEIKTGRERRRRMVKKKKKELIDLPEGFAGFTRAKDFFLFFPAGCGLRVREHAPIKVREQIQW